jgi:predicted DsbA family dithiol-disulfide isomerase
MHDSLLTRATLLLGLLSLAACGPLGLDHDSAKSDSKQASDSTVAAVIEGQPITLDEVHEHMKDEFLKQFLKQPKSRQYEMQETAIRDMVQQHIIDAEASKRGISSDELVEEITSSAPTPTAQDVQAWFSQNQSKLRGAHLEDIAPQIEELLASQNQERAWSEFLDPKLAALDWKMMLSPPRVDFAPTRLVRGPADAPVTITMFSDYQCPFCVRAEPMLAEVLARYPTQVRLAQHHFPLDSIHPYARPAAEAAMCADEQGRFWEFNDALFARAGKFDKNTFLEIGSQLGLDNDALTACIAERRYKDYVQTDFELGEKVGVTGTPAFFVNGIALKGARDADDMSRYVDSELERIQAN